VIAINYEDCNGCGDCVDICPTGAIILQNNKAVVDEVLCEGCQVCVDSCPQGAIVNRDSIPAKPEVVRITETRPRDLVRDEARESSLRGMALPALGSFLLWTGREILPRLADLAVNYLDRRVQANVTKDKPVSMQGVRQATVTRNGRRGRGRQRRQRRKRRFRT
jgi:NAD-dependent dihydropyrimidine dehydrogenase PreA subunit